MAAAEPQPFSQLVKKVRSDFIDKLRAKSQNKKTVFYFAVLLAAAGD